MTRSVFLPLVAAGALVLAACGSDSASSDAPEPDGRNSASSDAPEPDGRDFVSTSVEGQALVEGTDIQISFADGALTANAGCNTLGGDYTLDGDTLEVGPMFGTEMACEPSLMDQDTWLTEFLTSAPTVSLVDDELTLANDDGTTINMLDVESANPDRPIEGTLWIVDGIVNGDAVSSLPSAVTASIMITDGAATVETGCNAGSTSVEVNETTLTFSPMDVDLMLCPPAEMEVQDAVLAVLDGEVTYEIDADRLSIRRTTPTGVVGLELVATT